MSPIAEASSAPLAPPIRIDRTDTVVGIINEGVLTGLPHGTCLYIGWLGCWTQTIATRSAYPAWLDSPQLQSMSNLALMADLWGDGEQGVHWLLDVQHGHPELKVIACTEIFSPWILHNAWRLGMRHLVDIDRLTEDLSAALFECGPDERFCSETFQSTVRCHSPEARLLLQLGQNQRQVLALIGEGCDDRDASEILGVTPNAVGKLRRQLEKHFELKSRRELSQLARHMGVTHINVATTSRPWFHA